jgi:hypothetical protein
MKEISPFSVVHKQPMRADVPDLKKAVEVLPLVIFGPRPAHQPTAPEGRDFRALERPVVEEVYIPDVGSTEAQVLDVGLEVDPEVEVVSETGSADPKEPVEVIQNSSATDSVSDSNLDSNESGTPPEVKTIETPIHPSTLPPSLGMPASAVKELTPLPPPSFG